MSRLCAGALHRHSTRYLRCPHPSEAIIPKELVASPAGPGELRARVWLAPLSNGGSDLALGRVWTPCRPTGRVLWALLHPEGSALQQGCSGALLWIDTQLLPSHREQDWLGSG